VGLLACALLAVSPAGAGDSAATKTYRFRVVAVTHVSSSRKEDSPQYTGSSSSSWQLAPAAKRASNTITVTVGPGFARGLGRINVRGTFTAQAASNRPGGTCSLTARSASQQYAAVAPGRFTLTFAQSPKVKARARAVIGLRGAVYATLGNPYFPSSCSTGLTGEPPPAATHISLVTKTKLAQRVLTIVYGGKRSKAGITDRWKTTIRLKRR
jgi:hypothetical protein